MCSASCYRILRARTQIYRTREEHAARNIAYSTLMHVIYDILYHTISRLLNHTIYGANVGIELIAARNQNNVPEWNDMSNRRLLFQ
jgi:hypothetical protein